MRNPSVAKRIAPKGAKLIESYETRDGRWCYIYDCDTEQDATLLIAESRAAGLEVKQDIATVIVKVYHPPIQ